MTLSLKQICMLLAAVAGAILLGLVGKKVRDGGFIAGQREVLKKHIPALEKRQVLRKTLSQFLEGDKVEPPAIPSDEQVDDAIDKVKKL